MPGVQCLAFTALLVGNSGVRVIPGVQLHDLSTGGLGIVYKAWFILASSCVLQLDFLDICRNQRVRQEGEKIIQLRLKPEPEATPLVTWGDLPMSSHCLGPGQGWVVIRC